MKLQLSTLEPSLKPSSISLNFSTEFSFRITATYPQTCYFPKISQKLLFLCVALTHREFSNRSRAFGHQPALYSIPSLTIAKRRPINKWPRTRKTSKSPIERERRKKEKKKKKKSKKYHSAIVLETSVLEGITAVVLCSGGTRRESRRGQSKPPLPI